MNLTYGRLIPSGIVSRLYKPSTVTTEYRPPPGSPTSGPIVTCKLCNRNWPGLLLPQVAQASAATPLQLSVTGRHVLVTSGITDVEARLW